MNISASGPLALIRDKFRRQREKAKDDPLTPEQQQQAKVDKERKMANRMKKLDVNVKR